MCRMVATGSVKAASAAYETMEAPHSLLRQAECGSCGPHADGCGVAFVRDGKIQRERRGPANNWDESFKQTVRSISSQFVIAHNRKASGGLRIDESRSHPFVRSFGAGEAAFCHNGSVTTVMEEAKKQGVVDSEILFEQILAGQKELTLSTVARRVGELARDYKYTSLTAFLLTPDSIFAWRLFSDEKKRDYYTLSLRETDGKVVIASEPVDKPEGWTLVPNGTMYGVNVEAGKLRLQKQKLECSGLPA